jgi:hypothetical protein
VADLLVKKNIKVFAVDSFEGTTSEGDAHKEAKEIDLQEELKKNLTDFGAIGQVTIIKGMTLDVVSQFFSSQFDLIFVDADHTCRAVYNDIHAYYSKLKVGGVLAGHDWVWDSVKQALVYLQVPAIPNGDNMWHFEKKEGVILNQVDLDRINFSVCFIGRNEEKTLPNALKSLEEFKSRGGQVCYLDTGSTDNSAKVARDWGCTVEEVGTKFLTMITKEQADAINTRFVVEDEEPILKEGDKLFDFASARNYCADNLAKEDHVAWLDCDEGYTVLNIDKVIEEINNGAGQFEYEFVFSHDHLGAPLVQFIQSKFYNKKKLEWRGIVHECLHQKE